MSALRMALAGLLAALAVPWAALAQPGPENVLVVVNARSAISRDITEYYVQRRQIPDENVCKIRASQDERVSRGDFDLDIARPVFKCLKSKGLGDQISYIVTTRGVPLAVGGVAGFDKSNASVDSELALLYRRFEDDPYKLAGPLPNPFFGQYRRPFSPAEFRIYLVTRLTGYTLEDVKAMIDRGLEARNQGFVVLDMHNNDMSYAGNKWIEQAARILPADRIRIDRGSKVLTGLTHVIGYSGWGSNDPARRRQQLRWPGMEWLPGAIATEYVSTDARTFEEPPDGWTIGEWGASRDSMHHGSPQSMTADFIREGATGASGHTDEPYLHYTPRPYILFPAYLTGRNLAESYYLALPALSWHNVIVGDPLVTLK